MLIFVFFCFYTFDLLIKLAFFLMLVAIGRETAITKHTEKKQQISHANDEFRFQFKAMLQFSNAVIVLFHSMTLQFINSNNKQNLNGKL